MSIIIWCYYLKMFDVLLATTGGCYYVVRDCACDNTQSEKNLNSR